MEKLKSTKHARGTLMNDITNEYNEYSQQLDEDDITATINFKELMVKSMEQMENIAEQVRQGLVPPGIHTGLPILDHQLGGMTGGQLISLAARPGLGKTALGHQICMHAASEGHHVGAIHLEMSAEQIGYRSMAHLFHGNLGKLKKGDYDQVAAVGESFAQNFGKIPSHFYLDTQTYKLNLIIKKLAYWKQVHNLEFAMIDYLGLIETPGVSEYEQIRLISRVMKKTAKKLNIPILLLAQLNRAMERDKRRPQLSDLRGSGSIEQDIDIGIFLHTEADQQMLHDKKVEIGILKNRDGATGWANASYNFNGPSQIFTENEVPNVITNNSWQELNKQKLKELNL